MSEHAVLAPSDSDIWGNCTASIAARAGIPDPETDETRAGTAAHWVVSECLTRAITLDDAVGSDQCDGWLGKIAQNGVVINAEIIESAQVMVDEVLATARHYGALADLHVECRVAMPQIDPEMSYGTLDVALLVREGDGWRLIIWDYKHGHREVSPRGLRQLILYCLGMVNRLQIPEQHHAQILYDARIVQPRCYSSWGAVRVWEAPLTQLYGTWDLLRQRAIEVRQGGQFVAGPWCRDCRAQLRCDTARRADYHALAMVDEGRPLYDMTPEEKAVEWRIMTAAARTVRSRLEALEDDLTRTIAEGGSVGGLLLETSAGRLNWTKPPKQVIAMATMLGLDAGKVAVKTPTQLRDAARGEARAQLEVILPQFATRAAGGLSLVEADASRTALAFRSKRNAEL